MFNAYTPTRVLFGAGQLANLHEQTLPGSRAMVCKSFLKSKCIENEKSTAVMKLRMPKSVSYSHHNMLIILLKLRINAPRIIEYKVKAS